MSMVIPFYALFSQTLLPHLYGSAALYSGHHHRPHFHLSLYVEAIRQRRQEQQTPEFKTCHGQWVGIEGAISAAVCSHSARRSRYISQSKITLQELLMATIINLKRAALWLAGGI